MRVALSILALALAWAGLALGVEPVPTWFYVFAWYPTLILLDAITARRGVKTLFAGAGVILSLFGWSAAIWFVFEALNFRLENWYYVFLPRAGPERWIGITVSFATVVPAIVLAERALASLGVGERWRGAPMRHGLRHPGQFAGIGVAVLVLVLAWPRWFFPLAWGALFLLADPLVYRRRPDLSLMADVERGDWRRVGRLMLGGLLVGGVWECYNHWARGKWIYTVPMLEDVKWFEMPPLGFVGFPFFALEAWAMYSALVAMAVALPLQNGGTEAAEPDSSGDRDQSQTTGGGGRPGRRRVAAIGVAALFSGITLLGMERHTISSTVPNLGPLPTELQGIGSVWQLAAARAESLAAATGLPLDSTRHMVELARLATLRGIGTGHAHALRQAGVRTVCDLAGADAHSLWAHLHARNPHHGRRPTEAETRVWVRAARRACPA
jgi:hypothetical protein